MRFRWWVIINALAVCCVVTAWPGAAQSERRRRQRAAQELAQPTAAQPAAPPAAAAPAPAQVSTPTQEASPTVWTWKDASGQTRPRADLDGILAQHKQWLDSKGKEGAQANLAGCDLSGGDLTGADLRRAALANAKLNGAVLEHTNLDGADLINADLTDSDLQYAKLRRAILFGAKLVRAQLGLKAIPVAAAGLERARPKRSPLPDALKSALETGTAIPEAINAGADLGRADLRGADLTGAWLRDANLDLTIYEATADPNVSGIARARHLDLVTYVDDPEALVRLRTELSAAGFGEAENKITYAVNRKQTEQDTPVLRWFRRIAFDWTCQYGMNPARPLKIIGAVWLAMTVFYFLCMHTKGRSGIYMEATREAGGQEQLWRFQVLLPHLTDKAAPGKRAHRKAMRRLRWEWRLTRCAMFFSLISAFNIGYQEFNIGEWLKMLTKREYDLTAVGWARTVAGVQSLLSVYMLALWVLTFFGHPFE
ncbi:MAG TPA: pentapeptide repeat-containing protein [Terriglobia bacterium]|nr:pentapeptide repeat-containing protein [Terriglobia bacterium]